MIRQAVLSLGIAGVLFASQASACGLGFGGWSNRDATPTASITTPDYEVALVFDLAKLALGDRQNLYLYTARTLPKELAGFVSRK